MRFSIGEAVTRGAPNLRSAMALLSLSAVCAVLACSVATQDNFQNPPAGPPSSCSLVASVSGCAAGALSYSCASGRPDDGDTSIVCNGGSPGIGGDAGTTLYCCAPYEQWATECTPSSSVPGCGAQSLGLSCAGGTSPDEADTSLVCSSSVASAGGARDYCCVPFDQTSAVCRCASFDPASGACGVNPTTCAGSAAAFACSAGHAPSEVNPLLDCVQPDGGAPGTFCCRTP
jgi:hypothetical protein